MWLAILLFATLDAAGIYLLVRGYQADAVRAGQLKAARLREAAKPKKPPPPAMIHPPAVASVLQSGTLIVISKKSQNMYVFQDGALWAGTPISTGKRRHPTPSGVFPILQKRKYHRSNIYSGAPMPFMQRLTWDGIALHAGYVPGYPASHGCVRVPRAFALALFKLTNMKKTTVVIGDEPLESDFHAQQFALYGSAKLPIRSALAPPPDPPVVKNPDVQLAGTAPLQPRPSAPAVVASAAPPPPPVPAPPVPPPTVPPTLPPISGQTIQLTAAASQAEAEAHWARLLSTRPDISRFQKRVEPATVKARLVYRLRISGADAFGYCAKLKAKGIGCLNVS